MTVADKSQENATYDGLAVHTIDGNYNTFWYNNVSNADSNPFITLGLDSTKIVSAIEIVPHILNNYGRLSGGVVKGSLDGETFFVLKEFTVTDRNYDVLVLDIDEPREVNYIRIEAATDVNKYFFVKMINVFEDATDNSELTASIGYSTTKPTNSDVVARLINIGCSNYSILSDGGDTHIFTSNGEWEFRFIDNDTGKIGTATARVDWIDKTAPIGTFTYSTTTATDDEVIATLSTNKKVKVINNGYYEVRDGVAYDYEGRAIEGYIVETISHDPGDLTQETEVSYVVKYANGEIVNPFTYKFLSNGEFTFEFVDELGNRGSATARVDWITPAPEPEPDPEPEPEPDPDDPDKPDVPDDSNDTNDPGDDNNGDQNTSGSNTQTNGQYSSADVAGKGNGSSSGAEDDAKNDIKDNQAKDDDLKQDSDDKTTDNDTDQENGEANVDLLPLIIVGITASVVAVAGVIQLVLARQKKF